ncbi:MAG: VWA domain-containing protein [Myxococcales bacterium]|nr:VWA domain-containing protein [Myxococcales bacterium]
MLWLAACADGSGGEQERPGSASVDPGQVAAGAEAGGEASELSAYVCESTPTQACLCPNGAMEGTQSCVPDAAGGAAVGPCAGCPTAVQDSAAQSGALCAALQQQVGCEATTFRSEELPASVLFLVDRSGSMLCNAPPLQASADCGIEPSDASMPSKWDITVQSLGQTFGNLVGRNVNAALSFFSLDGECATDSAPSVALSALSDEQAIRLDDALASEQAEGRTPIVSALINAYQYMHWEARADCPLEPCGAPGNRFVVLLTDGSESCASPEEQRRLLEETVPDALDVNIRTFVIGAPGSEPGRGFLSELAYRGGTARSGDCDHGAIEEGESGDCHFDMTTTTDFAADLQAVLGDIGGSVGCSFAVSGSGSINVQYALGGAEPTCLEQSQALPCEGGAEGWQFAKRADGSDDPSQVVICGSACDAIQNDNAAQVDIVLGCTTLQGPE